MAQARAGTAFITLIAEVQGIAESIRRELNASSSTIATSTQQMGNDIGTQTGNAAGAQAADNFGKKLLAGVAALGLGALIADQLGKALEFQTSNNTVAAALNLTAKEAEKATAATDALYASGYGTYEEINETMRTLIGSSAEARNASAEDLSAMAKDVLNLQKVYGIGAEDIMMAQQSMVGTGLAKDFDEANQIILGGFQELGASGGDWLESLNEFSGDFKKFGLSGSQAIQLVGAAVKAGIKDTDGFVDAMNEIGIKINDGSADETLAKLGFSPDEVRKNLAAGGEQASKQFTSILAKLQADGSGADWAGVFGTKAEDYLDAFQNADFSAMNESLAEGTGNLEKFDATLNGGVQSSLDALKGSFDLAFQKTLMPVLAAVTPAVSAMAGFISQNAAAAQILAVVIGGVLLAALVVITVQLWSMAAATIAATWPILLIIVAIVAIIAVIILLATNWDAVIAGIGAGIGWLGEVFTGFWGWLQEVFGNVGSFFTDIGTGIGNFFIDMVNTVINAINAITNALNSLNVDLPPWLGGGTFGFDIPQTANVPGLAKGAVVNPVPGGTYANIAEAGKPEAIVDEGLLNSVLANTDKRLASGAGGAPQTFNIYQQPGESTQELAERLAAYDEFNGTRTS